MLATIIKMKPEILDLRFVMGQSSVLRAVSYGPASWAVQWSRRKATSAARKILDDWEDQCEVILAEGISNRARHTRITICQFRPNKCHICARGQDDMEKGSKQVTLVGSEEKRVFTVMVSTRQSRAMGNFCHSKPFTKGKVKCRVPRAKHDTLQKRRLLGFNLSILGQQRIGLISR
jgi:hypothetical protein